MIKTMTILGTRPELIKMSRVISELDKYTNHILVHTGQNYDYELNEIFFNDLDIRKPDYFLDVAKDVVSKTIAQIIEKSDEIMEIEKPDAILLYGDTNSCLSVISAKKRQIPIFHMEAGNRCFDQRVPEEVNRKVVDHLSDINLVLTEHARRYLIQEGIRQETIFKTGSHMLEVINHNLPKINKSNIIKKLKLSKYEYFLVSLHREENVDSITNLKSISSTLNSIVKKYDIPVVISTHPRTQKRLEDFNIKAFNPKIQFCKPFGFFDYIKLQMNALCIISDSGTITEESSILNLPAVTIREMHERPEGMDEGILVMSGLNENTILNSLEIVIKQYQIKARKNNKVLDYQVDQVSEKILRIVLSYIDYVNRTVWSKVK